MNNNNYIQKQITGMVQKVTWSMLWQKKEISVADVVKRGYKEASIRVALSNFVKNGWAEKPDGTRNVYRVSRDISK